MRDKSKFLLYIFIGHITIYVEIGMWLSLVERHIRDVEAAGSSPVIPTNKKYRKSLKAFGIFILTHLFLKEYCREIPLCSIRKYRHNGLSLSELLGKLESCSHIGSA